MPKVSVIIPTYNRAHTIAKAINSVLNQTFKDFELIVVDDGSTDDTKSIIGVFEDSRIRYVWQENQERSAARNTGIRISQGEYISLLDSDDEYLELKLESQVHEMNINPHIGLVMSGWIETDDSESIQINRCPWIEHPESEFELRQWLLAPPVNLYATLLRRNFLEDIGGFDEEITIGEDGDLLFRLIHSGCKTSWAKILALRFSPHTPDPLMYRINFRKVINKLFMDPALQDQIGLSKEQMLANLYLVVAFHAYKRGNFNLGNSQLQEAVQLDNDLLDPNNNRILQAIVSNAWLPNITDPVKLCEEIIFHLPDTFYEVKRKYRWILSRAWMSAGFRAHALQEREMVRQAVLKACIRDPYLLVNRGIVTIFVKSLI